MFSDPRRWRTLALSSDIPQGKPAAAVWGDDPFVLFRDADGRCRALADRCAHRRAPLSAGRVTPQFLIECPYHGWRYDGASGACAAIPNLRTDEKIPKNFRVPAYETHESDGFIQILLGVGEDRPAPNHVGLPDLARQWQGERFFAYPQANFVDTLVDCPSAILAIKGMQILDDHPFGEPIIEDGRATIEYAAVKVRRSAQPPKRVAADFPYTLQICASTCAVRVSLLANATASLCATAVLVSVPAGSRVTRALWRGVGPDSAAADLRIECRDHVDAAAVRASKGFVSQRWVETLV